MAHGCDTGRPLENCRIALAGRFASLTHEELRALVTELGGQVDGFPTRSTSYLVLGEGQVPLDEDAQPPRALEQARRLQTLGYSIEIVAEHEFWTRMGVLETTEPVRRLYTIGQLTQVLGVKRDLIRSWIRVGLICPVEIIHRLAFFDFAQVQSAKMLCDLAKRGVSTSRIRASLAQLGTWLPNLDVSLSQLALLEHGGRLLVRWGERGLIESTGQMQLDFGFDGEPASVPWSRDVTSDELFEEALERHDQGRCKEAAALYLRATELDPKDPILHFNLASAQYEQGLLDDSCAAYLAATQLDPQYVEAWNALGCVLSQMGRTKEAVVAFRRAVELVPDYGDAHYNLASELEQMGQFAAASQHWRRYIQLDPSGPWADTARERLRASNRERAAT